MPPLKTRIFSGLLAAASLTIAPIFAQAAVEFAAPFAPSEGLIQAPEKPARQEISLNGRWQFQPQNMPEGFERDTGNPPELKPPTVSSWEATPIKIPSPWNVNTWGNGRDVGDGTARPYVADSVYYPSYPAKWDGVEMGWLRRTFRVPNTWGTKRLFLHFEAVAGQAQILVNGKPAGEHFDSFLPFDLDITKLVNRGGDNELLVGVRKSDLFNVKSAGYNPNQKRTYPNGSNMDELVGIWNDVSLIGLPSVRVSDAFIKPNVKAGLLQAELTLSNDTAQTQKVQVGGEIKPWVNLAGKDVLSAPVPKWRLDPTVLKMAAKTVTIGPGKSATFSLQVAPGKKLKFWTPNTPNLYGAVFNLTTGGGRTPIDTHYVRFGWRQFTLSGKDLLLNGQKIQLTGDFLHPFGAYMSSRRFVWQFYKMIKDMGGNSTRPHAQPHPRAYLDLADEMGICVLDEAAIFGSSINLNLKEDMTWQRLQNHVDDMVLRDRNHPSVFGWSPGNEMFALFFQTEVKEKEREMVLLKALAQRPLALDSTRPWISVDGDSDLGGTMPTWSRHMGTGLPNVEIVPDIDEPRMIGEHGGTYYAGPPRLEEINGERSYESYAARNEALAIDLYRMITQSARKDLAVFSPSELAWFGLEHLPFGYRTDARPPSKTDGVFFPNYIENQPGVQIERLPPYAMTLNPGLDPQLPPYKPMAMFDAMKAALDPRGPQPSSWAKVPAIEKRIQPLATNKITAVAFAGNPEGSLHQALENLGVPLVTVQEGANASLLVIDGETVGAARADDLAKAVWARGGLVWIMVREKGAALSQIKSLLPAGVEITARHATSLARGEASPAIDGFGLGQLYFVAGDGDIQIQKSGMDGPILNKGKALLSASNSDWSLFERQPESAKSSSMLIYEHLRKPAGTSLLEIPEGGGRLWLSTLDATSNSKPIVAFWKQLWRNLGVKLVTPRSNWLVPTGVENDVEWRFTTSQVAADWMTPGFNATAWPVGKSGFGGEVPNGNPKTPWSTADIYLRKDFDLAQIPTTLNLVVHHDEDVEVYINGTQVLSEGNFTIDYKTISLDEKAISLLKVGKNTLAVHCHQTAGGQFLDVGLSSGALPVRTSAARHDLLLDGPLDGK